MQSPLDEASSSSPIAITLAPLAGTCVAAGAASLIDAADGWRDMLSVMYRSRPTLQCTGKLTIPGWGDDAVLVCTVTALVLLAMTGLAIARMHPFGQVTALLALLPIFVLWLDTNIVASAPGGDCDSLGLSGAASAAILRAGWLFFAAMVLCVLSSAWLKWRTDWRFYLPAD